MNKPDEVMQNFADYLIDNNIALIKAEDSENYEKAAEIRDNIQSIIIKHTKYFHSISDIDIKTIRESFNERNKEVYDNIKNFSKNNQL